MSNPTVLPEIKYASQRIYPADWNLIVAWILYNDQRLQVLEGATPPDVDYSSFPVGAVVPFWKPAAMIPAGWQICDGTNGTPDYRGFFLAGAGIDADLSETGGAETHTHTNPATNSAGSHTHSASGKTGGPSANASATAGAANVASAGHTHNISFNTGSAGSHSHPVGDTAEASNLPPYMKAYFITYMGA